MQGQRAQRLKAQASCLLLRAQRLSDMPACVPALPGQILATLRPVRAQPSGTLPPSRPPCPPACSAAAQARAGEGPAPARKSVLSSVNAPALAISVFMMSAIAGAPADGPGAAAAASSAGAGAATAAAGAPAAAGARRMFMNAAYTGVLPGDGEGAWGMAAMLPPSGPGAAASCIGAGAGTIAPLRAPANGAGALAAGASADGAGLPPASAGMAGAGALAMAPLAAGAALPRAAADGAGAGAPTGAMASPAPVPADGRGAGMVAAGASAAGAGAGATVARPGAGLPPAPADTAGAGAPAVGAPAAGTGLPPAYKSGAGAGARAAGGRPRARGLGAASPPRLLPAPSRAPGRPARPWTARLLAGAPARLVRREQSAHVSWVPACRPAQPQARACERAQAAVVAQRTLGAGQQAGERDRGSPRPPSGAAWKHGVPAACACLLLLVLQRSVQCQDQVRYFHSLQLGRHPCGRPPHTPLGVSLVSWTQSVSLFQQPIRLGAQFCLPALGRADGHTPNGRARDRQVTAASSF